jgi:hypothetical protein
LDRADAGKTAMSSKKKSQHFVPRHYLGRFSFDQGNRIRILIIESGKYIPEAGLKGQCARDYFYHTDSRVEENLIQFEGKAEEYFKKITEEHWLPSDGPTRNDLLTVLNVMRSRTEMFADQTLRLPETVIRESFRRYLEANNKHETSKVCTAFALSPLSLADATSNCSAHQCDAPYRFANETLDSPLRGSLHHQRSPGGIAESTFGPFAILSG